MTFALQRAGKGVSKLYQKMNGGKFPEKSFQFANTVRKIFEEIWTDLNKFEHYIFSKSIFSTFLSLVDAKFIIRIILYVLNW